MAAEKDAMVKAVRELALQVRNLGTANAGTPMGAIEFLASEVKEHGHGVENSVTAVADSLTNIAEAIHNLAAAVEKISNKLWVLLCPST